MTTAAVQRDAKSLNFGSWLIRWGHLIDKRKLDLAREAYIILKVRSEL